MEKRSGPLCPAMTRLFRTQKIGRRRDLDNDGRLKPVFRKSERWRADALTAAEGLRGTECAPRVSRSAWTQMFQAFAFMVQLTRDGEQVEGKPSLAVSESATHR
jgi:hypothetical protein